VTDDDPELANNECARLAAELWRQRREYLPDLVSVEGAVRQAHEGSGLTVLSDSADATTAGAPGDSTWLLRELLKYQWLRPALVTLVAPDVVAQAQSLGVGQEWSGTLGGVRDRRFAQP